MPPRTQTQLRPVNRLFEAATAPAEPAHEQFHVTLSAGDAHRLRALADDRETLAIDLIQTLVCDFLDEHRHDLPGDPTDGQHYPSNVIRLPLLH